MSNAEGGNPERDQMQDFLSSELGRARTVASLPTLLLFFSLVLFSCSGGGNEQRSLIPSSLPCSHTLLIYS